MEEFTVRAAPSSGGKKFNVFKLHKDDKVSWAEAKMRRENDHQPWQIKFGSGRAGRRFKAIKEGGVGENASYFVFYKSKDSKDTYEVCPVDEWYNMSATQRYKTLTAEEAEAKFEQRHKILNQFSIMKKSGENSEEGPSGRDSKAFKVSEMDEWDRSGDDLDSSDNENGHDSDSQQKKQRKKKNAKKEKDEEDAPDEGKEESDEGDFEQREVDYMSDTSSESSAPEGEERDENDVKGIAEEEALRDLLSTDDEEETANPQQKGMKFSDDKNALGSVDIKQDPDGEGSEDSSDSDDYDVDEDKMDSMFMKKGLPAQLVKQEVKQDQDSSNGPSSVANPTQSASSGSSQRSQPAAKRKAVPETSQPTVQPAPKKLRESEPSTSASSGQERVIEDLVKKYLSRKPMTLKNLLKEIKSKLKRLGGTTSEMDNDIVNTIAIIMKRLNPDRQRINDVTYFSLRA